MGEFTENTLLLHSSQMIENGCAVIEENVDEMPKEIKDFSIRKVSRNKKLLLIGMACMNFFAMTCFSLLAPFFPGEAAAKGVSQTVTGLIFSGFEFTIFASAPIFGRYVSRVGPKFMFISGAMVCGGCAILFGVLDKGPDGTIFIVMCFLCRTLEGLGCSAYVTALFAIIAYEFPSNVATVFGLLESFTGMGAMVGPPIGGALHSLGGYGLPFFVNGAVVIINAILCSNLIPNLDGDRNNASSTIFSLLRSPLAVIAAFCVTACSFSFGFLDPTLANHLSKFNLSTFLIGLVFLIMPAIYAFTSPLWGWVSDSKNYVSSLIIFGNLFTVVGFLVMGPTPLIPFLPYELWSVIVGLVVAGFALGTAWSATFKCLIIGARHLGMPDNFDTYGLVSGSFNSCFSLGAFLGPTIGGILVDRFNFGWGASFCSLLYIIAAGLMSLYALARRCCCPLPEKSLPVNENVMEVQKPSSEQDQLSNV